MNKQHSVTEQHQNQDNISKKSKCDIAPEGYSNLAKEQKEIINGMTEQQADEKEM